jgi:hypothetical protein
MRSIPQFIFCVGVLVTSLAIASIALSQQQPVRQAINPSGAKPDMPSMLTVASNYDSPASFDGMESVRQSIQEPDEPLAVSAKPLIGTWVNADRETGGLASVTIVAKGKEVTIHALGACEPNPCNLGVVSGIVYAQNVDAAPAVAFTAKYTLSFEQIIMVGHLVKGSLQIESFTHFTDESGRVDYYRLDVMIK